MLWSDIPPLGRLTLDVVTASQRNAKCWAQGFLRVGNFSTDNSFNLMVGVCDGLSVENWESAHRKQFSLR